MWNSENQKAVGSRQKADNACTSIERTQLRQLVFCLLLFAFCLLVASCRRDMQDQPKAIAYRESSFYKDGTGSRPLVEGTVPRGYLREDRALYLGKKPAATTPLGPTLTQPAGGQATAPSIRLPTAPASATNP